MRIRFIFEFGQPASAVLQAMAEGGDIAGFEIALGGTDDDTVANPATGLLGPGSSVMADNTDNPVFKLMVTRTG